MPESKAYNNLSVINTGPLNSLASLIYHIAKPLKDYSQRFTSGRFENIQWDMTNIMPLHQSMVTLTAFLSISHRLRIFTGCPQAVKINWNPRVLSFWNDISFFHLTEKYDLIKWPDELIGGFPSGVTNPNTLIVDFAFNPEEIPDQDNLTEWKEWKDDTRERVKQDLLLRCGGLFTHSRRHSNFPSKFKDQVAITSAELVVNSLLHGRSMAFLGLQRSNSGITISVCDCGFGFLTSLRKLNRPWALLQEMSNIQAITIGSLANSKEMGLRRAIDSIVNYGGHVIITSNDAEIRWEKPLWDRAKDSDLTFLQSPQSLPNINELLGPCLKGKLTSEKKQNGYPREWDFGIRGTRISFELDFKKYEHSLKGI